MMENLPPSWNDFKIYLKHKRIEIKMEDLVLMLWFEKDLRKGDKVDKRTHNAKINEVQEKK